MIRKKYIKYYIATLVVSLLFICKGGAVGLVLQDLEMVFSASSQTQSTHSCCGETLVASGFFSGISFDFIVSPLFDFSLIILVILLGLFLYKIYKVPKKYLFSFYTQHIRWRFGSWNIFHAIIHYFSVGILHPKIY